MPPKGRKKAAVAATCSADVDAEFPPIEKILQDKSQPAKSGRGRKKAIVSDDETIVMGKDEIEQKVENGAGDNGTVNATKLNGNGTPNNTEKEVDAFDRLLLDNTTKKDDWKLEFSPDASRLSQNGAKPVEKDSEEEGVKSNGKEALNDETEADNDAKSLSEKSDSQEDPVKASEEEIKETEPEEDKIELEKVPEKRGRKKVAEKVPEDSETKEEPEEPKPETEKAPVKRGRKKATDKAPEEEIEEVIEIKEEPEKVVGRRGRKKAEVKEEPTRVLAKRGQRKAEEPIYADNDEIEEDDIEEPVAKRPAAKSGHKKAEVIAVVMDEVVDEETEEEEKPVAKRPAAKSGRKKAEVVAVEVEDEETEEEEKPVARRGRMKKHEEESKPEKEPPKRGRKKAEAEEIPDEKAEEEPRAKRGRGKAETDEVSEEPRAMRGRKKVEVVDLEDEKPSEKRGRKKAEVSEEPEKVTGKRGRKPAEVEAAEAPGKKGRKRKADANKKEKEVDGDDISDFAGKELRVAMVRDPEIEELAKRTSPTQPSGKKAGNVPKPNSDATFVMAKPAKEQPAKSGRKRANQESEDSKPEKVKKEEPAKQGKSGAKKAQIPDVSSQDFGSEAKTSDGQPWNFKIASWNVNGIRAWVEKGGLTYLKHENPDILCIQETKCSKDKLPEEVLKIEGYHTHWLAGDKEGYSGVGLISKEEPISVTEGIGLEEHDNEGRVITAEYEKFYLVTTYVPNSGRGLIKLDYRKTWDEDFRAYLKKLDEKKPVVLCGDLNVAHEEIDIANPKSNKKNAGFTQEERDGFSALLKEGFVDAFRHLYPEEKGAYTFWTYMMNARAKNVGWRLDYFVISERFKDHLCDSFIRKDVMGSDHCPVGLLLHV